MLSPIKKNKNICRDRDYILDSLNNNLADTLVDNIVDNFELSPSYEEVYKNNDFAQSYKTWIYEGSKADKLLGFKYMLSYPYEDIKFNVGDFIHWNYDKGNGLSTWFVQSLNKQQYYDTLGRILQCNQKLRWRNDLGEIHSVDCVLMDSMTYVNFLNKGSDGIVEASASIVVLTQKNAETAYVQKNKRFIFGSDVFMVKQVLDSLYDNYLQVFLSVVPEQKEDDFVNSIAWNGEDITEVVVNETIITPDVYEISLYDTVTFDIFKYANGEKQTDGFLITATGVPSDAFDFVKIDDNHFSIESLKEYKQNPLIIKAINLVDSSQIERQVWLRGGWL